MTDAAADTIVNARIHPEMGTKVAYVRHKGNRNQVRYDPGTCTQTVYIHREVKPGVFEFSHPVKLDDVRKSPNYTV